MSANCPARVALTNTTNLNWTICAGILLPVARVCYTKTRHKQPEPGTNKPHRQQAFMATNWIRPDLGKKRGR